jgi:VanZ family protein
VKYKRPTIQALCLAAVFSSAGCGRLAIGEAQTRFTREVEWAGRGVWLKADTHVHTQFSDGAYTVEEVVDQAARYGCDVLAITDHADRNLAAGTHEYIEAIKEARRQHPNVVLLAGLEWNIPPYDGDEHVVVLFPQGPNEGVALADFKAQFDDLGREVHEPALADEALEWLASLTAADGVSAVAIYEHPSRKRQASNQIVGDVRRWRAVNDILIGMAGAPGHQGMEPTGSYQSRLKTLHRWDPVVANVGDAWDKLLEKGIDVWAAHAPSDFHDASAGGLGDYWPGQFSETWLYAPDHSAEGALRALRAGAFFGVHGHIAREVELFVEAKGLSRPAISGESIEVPPGSQVTVRLQFKTPDKGWDGQTHPIENVELIKIAEGRAESLGVDEPSREGPALTKTVEVPDGGLVLRARGGSGDLMFYTNPVRVIARSSGTPLAVSSSTFSPIIATARSMWTSALSARPFTWIFYSLAAASMLAVVFCIGRVEEHRRDVPWSTTKKLAPRRIHYLLLAMSFSAFVIYGSWVPFDFQSLSLAEAWQRFLDAPGLTGQIAGSTDFSTNVLLMVPVSFSCLAAMTCDRVRPWLSILVCSPLTLVFCSILSFVVEFGQVYCLPRVCSYNDIAAQMFGAIIGVGLWSVAGKTLTGWLRRLREARPARSRWEWLLQAYFLGFFLYALLPFDLITRPSEIVRKYGHGMIVLVPFADFNLDASGWCDLVADILTYIPVGVLATIAYTSEQKPLRSLPASVFWGFLLATGVETCQVFIYSRFASTTQLVAAAMGILIGVLARHWHERRRATASQTGGTDSGRWRLAAASLLYTAFLLGYFWSPYDWLPTREISTARQQTFFDIPINNLFWTENFSAMTQVVRKATLFGVLGMLLEYTARAWTTSLAGRRWLRAGLFCLACLVSVGIELGQLWLADATPSLSDAFVYDIDIMLGIMLASKFAIRSVESADSKRGRSNRPVLPSIASNVPFVWRRRTVVVLLGGLLAFGGVLWLGASLLEAKHAARHASVAGSVATVLSTDMTVAKMAPSQPAAAPHVRPIQLPHIPGEMAIWGSTGRDHHGQIWFGVSCWPGNDASAHLFQFVPESGDMVDRGDVLTELKQSGVYRAGESQQKIHSKIVQAADRYLYFSSMDEAGEKDDGSRLPVWGSHLWRLGTDDRHWEHLLRVPEGLIAVATAGRYVYALGYFEHVLYQWNIDTRESRSVQIGAVGGHISRNFFCDGRGHVYVPKVTRVSTSAAVESSLVELDDELHEVTCSPLKHYLPGGDLQSHGIVGVQHLDDRSIVFVTHVGYLYRVVPRQGSAAELQPLGWFHPHGQHYVASLFAYSGSRYVMGAAEGQPFEWLVYDLVRRKTFVSPMAETKTFASLGLYGCDTTDEAGAFYLVGTHQVRTSLGLESQPIILRAEPLR